MESVLFVCTGNICRSPMAHVMLVELLKDSGNQVVVRSAGVLNGGYPSTDKAIEVMRRRNLDLSSHRSTALSEALPEPADLIIGMAGQHLREIVAQRPDLLSCTFTLKELARRTKEEGPRRPAETMQSYLERIGKGRKPSQMMGSADDVADPIGRPIHVYNKTADEIYDLVNTVKPNLWP